MNIYKLTQNVNNDYDTYDSVIVCATDEKIASEMNPGGFRVFHDNDWYFQFGDGTEKVKPDNTWCHPRDVNVEYLGNAKEGIRAGIILASFNAG